MIYVFAGIHQSGKNIGNRRFCPLVVKQVGPDLFSAKFPDKTGFGGCAGHVNGPAIVNWVYPLNGNRPPRLGSRWTVFLSPDG
jgi:hypothetical protein